MSKWSLEGYRVSAVYIDRFHVNGIVEKSHINFDGEIYHTVLLDRYIKVLGVLKDKVTVNHRNVTGLLGYPKYWFEPV